MKSIARWLPLFLLLNFPALLGAQFGSPEELAAEVRVESVMEKVRKKAEAGKVTAAKLAPEFAELDGYIAEFVDYPKLAARFAYLKLMLHAEVLSDFARAREVLAQMKQKYPNTDWTNEAEKLLPRLEKDHRREAVRPELEPLVKKMFEKGEAGARGEKAFAEEFKALDALLRKYASNAEAAAQICYIKASVTHQLLEQPDAARSQLEALVAKYPGTLAAEAAEGTLARIKAQ